MQGGAKSFLEDLNIPYWRRCNASLEMPIKNRMGDSGTSCENQNIYTLTKELFK